MRWFIDLMTQFIHVLYNFTVTIGFPSYALAIILLGIIVRVLLFPLSMKQMKSTLGMAEIQPELQQLQKKYANNREKLSEEMNKLYKEYSVNPAAGCLPILIQMPILYALFVAMREYNFAENASFFWIESLNDVDPYKILPILLALVMFLQQKLAMVKGSPAADNPTMKIMLYVMPVMMGFFALNFPSGLCLYWVTTSTLMIFQQLVMNRSRKIELEKRAVMREKIKEEREERIEEEKRKGQNPSKRKTKQQLKTEHKAKQREANSYKAPGDTATGFNPNKPKATYKPPKK